MTCDVIFTLLLRHLSFLLEQNNEVLSVVSYKLYVYRPYKTCITVTNQLMITFQHHHLVAVGDQVALPAAVVVATG